MAWKKPVGALWMIAHAEVGAVSAGLIIEGITLQHAGELLYDSARTEAGRSPCYDTYLKSLEDVVFAFVLSPRIVVTQNLVGLGVENPGKKLVTELLGSVPCLESSGSGAPADLLIDQDWRCTVREWLTYLHEVPRSRYLYWRDFIIRESAAYLIPPNERDQAQLNRELDDPREYTYAKDYGQDRELQAEMTGDLIQHMYLEVARLYRHVVCRAAAREFVERCVLAHVLIFVWYRRVEYDSAEAEERRAHLPHITRATLIPASDSTIEALGRLRRIVMPHVLGRLLKAKNRDELLQCIGYEINGSHYTKTRKFLGDAIELLDSDAIDEIAAEAERETLRSGDDPVNVNLSSTTELGPLGPKVSFSGGASGKIRGRRPKYWSELMHLTRPATSNRDEMLQDAARVFPELAEGIRQSRQ